MHMHRQDIRTLTNTVVFLMIQPVSFMAGTGVGPSWGESITHPVLSAAVSQWPVTFINICTHTHTEHFGF